ncbi:RNA polymerase sigma factor [Novosphingobium resinovorum]|uniref:RNA polymerase sigma factor n=1 Tax=Sphingomonadaceae TaxID=41297 RepID=UPI00027C97D5|nr:MULTISPECIES: RNA polymerase sigma factor [Sphingomonadaceae]EJU11138.1 ECF subfamily RNA polymerase sigma-70 factor [Sphingomonas sp. LH128]WJM26116.1 RNA polymerase sigma factor [Novosphingobium resinovorum]
MTGSASKDDARDDAAAVAAALAGKQFGFDVLMEAHRSAVFRMVRGYLDHEADALDVTQDSFVAAFLSLHRYDPARPFRAWLLRIALNKCRDWTRRRAVRRLFAFALPIEDAAHVPDAQPDPEAALKSRQEVARIHAAIAALPDTLKEPLLLCAMEGLPQDEAAAILGVSRKAVETRIYRARQKLSHLVEG